MLSRILLILILFFSAHAVVPENLTESAKRDLLFYHNAWRSSFSLPLLVWDSTLETYAKSVASVCHSNVKPYDQYGKNMYFSYFKRKDDATLTVDAVQSWTSQSPNKGLTWACITATYGNCARYSQIVWKNTTNIGCSIAHCAQDENSVICLYNPPGNQIGQVPY